MSARQRFIVVGLLVLGVALRGYHYFREPSMWHDEAAVAVNVLNRGYAELPGPLAFHEACAAAVPVAGKDRLPVAWRRRLRAAAAGLPGKLRALPLLAWAAAACWNRGPCRGPSSSSPFRTARLARLRGQALRLRRAGRRRSSSPCTPRRGRRRSGAADRLLPARARPDLPVLPSLLPLRRRAGGGRAGGLARKKLSAWAAYGLLAATVGGAFLALLPRADPRRADPTIASCWLAPSRTGAGRGPCRHGRSFRPSTCSATAASRSG